MKWDNTLAGPFDEREMRLALEELGRQGFELVSAYATGGWHFAALKRPVPEAEPPKSIRSKGRVQE